jgi:hypothetical protein
VGFLKTGASAIGKLLTVAALAGAFVVGLVGVVWLSLQGQEVKVPEVVGKDFGDSEKELTQIGLKIKRRAFRFSVEKPNTVIEQSPRAGEPVKTGQIIFVVVSQANPESTEAPATVNKDGVEEIENDDTSPDAPKKNNKNANVKKPTQTTRDVSANKPAKNSNTNTSTGTNSEDKPANTTTTQSNKPPATNKPVTNPSPKPSPAKTPTSGDTRSRKVPN